MVQAVVVVAVGEEPEAEALLRQYQAEKFPGLVWSVVTGGRERQDSVERGIAALLKQRPAG